MIGPSGSVATAWANCPVDDELTGGRAADSTLGVGAAAVAPFRCAPCPEGESHDRERQTAAPRMARRIRMGTAALFMGTPLSWKDYSCEAGYTLACEQGQDPTTSVVESTSFVRFPEQVIGPLFWRRVEGTGGADVVSAQGRGAGDADQGSNDAGDEQGVQLT